MAVAIEVRRLDLGLGQGWILMVRFCVSVVLIRACCG